MGLDSLCVPWIMTGRNSGFAEEFLEKRVHGLKAVGITSIIAQEDVMFQKENIVLPAVEENQTILTKLIIRSEFFAKQRATGFCDDVVFHVDNNLRHLLAHPPDDPPPRGLQFRQPCFYNMRLLTALEMFAPLAYPFLAFEDQDGKLIAYFEGQKFQQAQPEKQVNLNVFVILGLHQRTLQQLGEQLAEAPTIRSA